MKNIVVLVAVIFSVSGLKSPVALGAQLGSQTVYTNDRFTFSFKYPTEIFKTSTASDNDDGVTLISSNGEAEVQAYGSFTPLVENIGLAALYSEAQNLQTGLVSYKTLNLKGGFFIISGTDDGKVFYQKSFIQGDTEKTILIQYPVSAKKWLDPITSQISKSFVPDLPTSPMSDHPVPPRSHVPVVPPSESATPSFHNFRASCYAGPYTYSGFQCAPQRAGDVMNAYSKAQACAIGSATTACRASGYAQCSYIGVESTYEAGAPVSGRSGPPASSEVCYVNVIVQGR